MNNITRTECRKTRARASEREKTKPFINRKAAKVTMQHTKTFHIISKTSHYFTFTSTSSRCVADGVSLFFFSLTKSKCVCFFCSFLISLKYFNHCCYCSSYSPCYCLVSIQRVLKMSICKLLVWNQKRWKTNERTIERTKTLTTKPIC